MPMSHRMPSVTSLLRISAIEDQACLGAWKASWQILGTSEKMIKHAIFSSQSSVYSWWGSIQSITDLNPDFKESLDIEIMKKQRK